MPLLASTSFIVTGFSRFFRDIQLDPAANLGVVKIDSDDVGYHVLWGLTNETVPTSELPVYFLPHCERIETTNGKDWVIIHYHATNLIALTYILENDTAVLIRQLWEGSTECLVVFPDSIGILSWMVLGTDKIGRVTVQEIQKHSLVLWSFHGVFGSGLTLDETFGLIDTAEKSAQVLVKVYLVSGMEQTISRKELIVFSKRFGVTPLASTLALQGVNMIRKASVMQVDPGAHEECRRRCNPTRPELEVMSESRGVHNYVIYLDKARNLLFTTVEIEPEGRWNAVTSTDVCQRWQKCMIGVMLTNSDNSSVSSKLQEVSYPP